MEIVVNVEQVLDSRLPVEVTPQGVVAQKGPAPVFVANPADRSALEEAMRIREEIPDCSVTVITLGPKRAERLLADCLARGTDRAIHLLSDDSAEFDAFAAARLLSKAIKRIGFDLILCGDRTLDDGPNEVGPILAELLDIAQVTRVVKLNVSESENKIQAERKLERGYRQVVEANLPALVTVDSSVRQPRYVTIRARRCAARAIASGSDLVQIQGFVRPDYAPTLRTVLRRTPPRPRPKKVLQPDANLSAADRLALIMGGPTDKKSNQSVATGPEQAADEVIAFLKDKGILS